MRKLTTAVVFGFVLFSFRHVVKPAAHAVKTVAHAAYKAAY